MKISSNFALLRWFGGKYYQTNVILPFPYHETYLEMFGGGGSVLINKIPSKVEIYNDINSNLVNFWKTFRDHYFWFRILNFCLPQAKEIFENFKDENYEIIIPEIVDIALKKLNVNKNNLERAVSFFYLNSYSFSGNNDDYVGVDFAGNSRHAGRYPSRIEEGIEFNKIWKRIRDVQFINRDYRKIMNLFDRTGVLIYLDPPYREAGEWYVKVSKDNTLWKDDSYIELNNYLSSIKKAMFVLSIDSKGKNFFENKNWFYQEIMQESRGSPSKKKIIKKEYIIRNFDNDKINKMIKSNKIVKRIY